VTGTVAAESGTLSASPAAESVNSAPLPAAQPARKAAPRTILKCCIIIAVASPEMKMKPTAASGLSKEVAPDRLAGVTGRTAAAPILQP
jgi:hypothetical protein